VLAFITFCDEVYFVYTVSFMCEKDNFANVLFILYLYSKKYIQYFYSVLCQIVENKSGICALWFISSSVLWYFGVGLLCTLKGGFVIVHTAHKSLPVALHIKCYF
jgi:hypothetical protein